MEDMLFLVKVDDFGKIINDKRTPLKVIDDFTMIQPFGYPKRRLAYLCEAGRDYSICHADINPMIPPHIYNEVSYVCYGLRCVYCGGVVENNQDMLMRIYCKDCPEYVDTLNHFNAMKLMIQNGTIIKEKPRWRWVK